MKKPISLVKNLVVSVRFEEDQYERVKDIAALETLRTGRIVSYQDLIRNAVSFVYDDNERLRECFKRSRAQSSKRKSIFK